MEWEIDAGEQGGFRGRNRNRKGNERGEFRSCDVSVSGFHGHGKEDFEMWGIWWLEVTGYKVWKP
jgi:hypothetical protein